MTKRVLKFGAGWCTKCRMLKLDNCEEIDIDNMSDENSKLLDSLGATELPVIVVLNDDKVLDHCEGSDDATKVKAWIDTVWSTHDVK